MSAPDLTNRNPVRGASLELSSAISSLHMYPEPIAEPVGRYLSETDKWAAHSIEHIQAALGYLNRMHDLCAILQEVREQTHVGIDGQFIIPASTLELVKSVTEDREPVF